jgi:hypothetical protein
MGDYTSLRYFGMSRHLSSRPRYRVVIDNSTYAQVPVLFDADPIEESGFESFVNLDYSHTVYWRSERQRNILRRVCSGWNAYLNRFNHRLVRLEDVRERLVPKSAIPRAVRLEYPSQEPPYHEDVALIREAILASDEPWRLEILDGGHTEIDNLIIKSGKVLSICSIWCSEDIELKAVASIAPNVRFIDLYFSRKPSADALNLSQLTSLSILVPDVAPLLTCSFPSLKHLSIYTSSPSLMTMEDFQQLLTVMGENLVTLLDNSTGSDELLSPKEVWYRCPNLRRFQTSLAWPADAWIPESLHTLQIPFEIIPPQSYSIPSRIPIPGLQSVRKTVISFSEQWQEVMEYNRGAPMSYVTCAIDLGIPFYDLSGVTFQDFIVRLLRHRKAGIRKPAPGWDTEGRYF